MAKAKAPAGADAIIRRVLADLEGLDVTPDVKKKVMQLVRDSAQVEGVSLAKKGQTEDEVWKGIFLKGVKGKEPKKE